MRRLFRPVDAFLEAPFSGIIAYPRPTRARAAARVAELRRLGVGEASFRGPARVCGLDVLGKGYAGVVFMGRAGRRPVAVKARRLDSPRGSMAGEARMLRLANAAGAGPRLVAHSRNFVVMEHLRGLRMGEWAASLGPGAGAGAVRARIREVLEECRRLDEGGIDHGELSRISGHVVVGRRARLVDFESASGARRPSNVTSAAQGIFIGSGVSRGVGRAVGLPPRGRAIAALRRYKAAPGRESFAGLLAALGL